MKHFILFIFSCILIGQFTQAQVYDEMTQKEKRKQRKQWRREERMREHNGFEEEDKEEEGLDGYDGPDKAAQFEFERTKDPLTGKVPREKLLIALDRAKASKYEVMSGRAGLAASALSLTWTERGPNTDAVGSSNGNTRANSGVTSGRIRAVLVDSADATHKTVWVGGVDGGLWKTTDITVSPANWVLVNDYLSNLAVTDICQDPSNSNIMYFCTGEAYYNADAVKGNGVFKSTDHGVTWTQLSSTSIYGYCTRILCDYQGNLYLGTRGYGVVRSTDGGANWTNITPTGISVNICDMEISSTSTAGRLHIVAGIFSTQTYRFTDIPSTVTASSGWTAPTTAFPSYAQRAEIACRGAVLYAMPVDATYQVPTIYKSTDGGVNWAATTAQPTAGWASGQGWYALSIDINPANTNQVIIGGLDSYKTTNGGGAWTKISNWVGTTGQYVHADIHDIQWYDGGTKLIWASDGGIFYSADGGTTIRDRNVGLRIKQFYSCAINPTAGSNYMLAGAQDNGVHQLNGAGITGSTEVTGGDGCFVAIDQDQPAYQYGSYVYNVYRRSTNSGSTWSSISFYKTASNTNFGSFVNPFDLDNTNNVLYAGADAGEFFRWTTVQTTTAGSYNTASALPTGVSIVTGITALNASKVSTVKVSPYTNNRVYFGTAGGRIIYLDNANTAANSSAGVNITGTGMPASNVSCINVGTSDQKLIASFSNYSVSNVWVSLNGGTSWTAIDGNLPDMPVRWCMFLPGDSTKAILATEAGVWTTDLINGASTVWNASPTFPAVRTDMLKYRSSDGTLVAATHGRGLWTTVITACTPPTVSASNNGPVCPGQTINLTGNSNQATATYSWTGPNGFTSTLQNPTLSNVTASMAGVYTFIATYNGCSSQATTTVSVNAAPPTANNVSICQGASSSSMTSNGGCISYSSPVTVIAGNWNATSDSTAFRLSSMSNSTTCSFDAVSRNYVATKFQVSISGSYKFEMLDTTLYDAMGYITSGSFVPGSCTAGGNWVVGDDDGGLVLGNEPQLTANLNAGVTYTLISTTYDANSGAISAPFQWNITPPSGGQVLLGVNTGVNWYTSSTSSTSIASGNSFNPVGVSGSGIANTNSVGTTVFYIACPNNTGCRSSVSYIINAVPSVPTANVIQPTCTNSSDSIIVTSSVAGLSFSVDGTNYSNTTGVFYNLPAGNYNLTAKNANNCISSPLLITINTPPGIPNAPVAIGNSRCGTGSVQIAATPGNNETVDWYTSSTGGVALLSGSISFNTPVISNTTVYYAASRNLTSGCVSGNRTAVSAIIKNSTSSTTNVARCSNQLPFVWNGNSYNTGGTYSVTLTNSVGCDSIANLLLTIKSVTTSVVNVSRCSNQLPYVWNGLNYNAAGSYSITLTNNAGCDSIATLNLTVKQVSTSQTNIIRCSNQLPYVWNGVPYNTSGTYTWTGTNMVGCDSVATLNLLINSTSSSLTSVSVCSNQLPYVWNANSYNSPGTYSWTGTNASGCDSVATLNLTVINTSSSTTNINICYAQTPYNWNGASYYASGIYTKKLTNAAGCDSTAILNLTVNNPSYSSTQVSVCNNSLPYVWNGQSYNASGTYQVTLQNTAGCDSIANLTLTVSNISTSSATAEICASDLPYVWNGQSFNASGTYQYQTIGVSGCDSIAYLNLIVHSSTSSTTSVSICNTQLPYVWNGISYTIGGVKILTLTNSFGCDSVATLILDVTEPTNVDAGTYSALTTQSPSLTLTGSPVGGTFSGPGVLGNVFYPASTGAGTFRVLYTYTDPAGICTSVDSAFIIVNSACNFAVGANIIGTSNACGNIGIGDSAVYTIDVIDAAAFSWSVSNATTMGLSVNRSGGSVKLKFSTAFTTGTITVNVTGCNGSVITRTLSITKTVPGTPAAINGPVYICPYIGGSNVTYTVTPPLTNASSVLRYRWSLPTGAQWVSVNAVDSSSITIRYPSTPTSLSISVIAISGCGNSAAKAITLNATAPAAPSSIIGPLDVCNFIGTSQVSSDIVYSVAAVNNAASYLWTVPAGVNIIAGQGTTSITVNIVSSFVSGAIAAQSISPCGNSTPKSLTVYKRIAATPGTIQKEFTPSIAAVTNTCGVSSEQYKIRKVTYATSYLWTMKSGIKTNLIHQNIDGINDTVITLNFLSGFIRDTISVQAVTPCNVSVAKTLVLSAVLLPPSVSSISGTTAPCIGNQITYTASAPVPTSSQSAIAVYRWTKPNNTTIISAAADSTYIVLQYNTGFTGGTITAKGQSACGVQGSAKSITLQYLPPTPSSITSSTGNYNACIGNQINYTAVVPAPSTSQRAAVVYRWTKPNNTTIISATADSMTITLQFNTGYTGGSITVKGQTSCGAQGSAKSQALTHTGCPTGTSAEFTVVKNSNSANSNAIYPNPNPGEFDLNIQTGVQKSQIARVEIIDEQGVVVNSISCNNLNGKISRHMIAKKLTSGIYTVKVMTDGYAEQFKMVVQK